MVALAYGVGCTYTNGDESISQMVFALRCLLQWIVRLSESRDCSSHSWHLNVRCDIMGYRKGEDNI